MLEVLITGKVKPFNKWALIETALYAITVYWWYYLDKRERSIRTGAVQNIGVAALAIIALPIYFFRSRGFKGGVIASLLFLGLVIGCGVLALIGEEIGQLGASWLVGKTN